MALTLVYLGHAGFSLSDGTHTVLVDPFLTGNPIAKQRPADLHCQYIALTHGHSDHVGDTVAIAKRDGRLETTRVTKLYVFDELKRIEAGEAVCGEIVALAGFEGINVGETVTSAETPAPLPPLHIDEPTISMVFQVNTAPFAGRDGRYVTSRNIKERPLLGRYPSDVSRAPVRE